jgi:hypothetical protein
MKYLHHYECYKVFHACQHALTLPFDNEQHDQQRLQTNYWQKNVLNNMILQYYNNTTTYYRTYSLCVAYPSVMQYVVMI